MSTSRLTILTLVPVLLLAGIAAFGLVEYRHSITADARATAQEWIAKSDAIYEEIVAHAEASEPVVLYRDIPLDSADGGEDAERLVSTTREKNGVELRELIVSENVTASGLPVRVLAAWQIFKLTGDPKDGEILADLAINKAPSAISEQIIESFVGTPWWQERLGDWISMGGPNDGQDGEWTRSERKRAVLRAHPDADGFVRGEFGRVAFVRGGKVALIEDCWDAEMAFLRGMPKWMAARVAARGGVRQGYAEPLPNSLASGGFPIRIEVGIKKPKVLYARYWSVVWWVSALMVTALGTALAGSALVRRTLDRERRLGELKSQFVASVSHELRTPVASMRLMADALDAGKVDGAAARKFHRLMSQEGARLSALIENVLDFARIEEGKKDYRFADADLAEVVADTVALMEPVAKERGITIACEAPDLAVLEIDHAAMQQALVNLIDNAIKFSPDGGVVTVALAVEEAGGWEFSVADAGPGIPEAEREHVFERFSRLGNELRRETQGAGIGLSIVKHIVEAHGATISIIETEGGGATFRIHRAASAPSPAVESRSATSVLEPCDS